MSSDNYSEKDHHEDVKILHGMGYAQELSRSMSKFSNFAISFSIICILSGGINSSEFGEGAGWFKPRSGGPWHLRDSESGQNNRSRNGHGPSAAPEFC
jgi:hypothetical protein